MRTLTGRISIHGTKHKACSTGWQTPLLTLIFFQNQWPSNLRNCEEELPKKPVGQLSGDCRPTDYRQITNRLPTGDQQATDS